MAASTRLGADELRSAVTAFRDALRSSAPILDRLNVYPVPDGDTGKNMAGTMEKVVAELAGAGPGMAEVCRAVSYGSLMGASGNSGIILCQVLRGFAEVAAPLDPLGPAELARALRHASVQADGAVARPVEGTILSVVRAAAGAAEAAAAGGSCDLVGVLEASRGAAVEALARTPEQLPVLAEAGVVDAGGAGFCLFLDALLHAVDGRPLPEAPPVPVRVLEAVAAGALDAAAGAPGSGGGGDVSDLRYEVMFLLEADDATVPAFREAWTGVGDSIVVVGGDGLWNCHIHTDDIGAAIEVALDAGRPRRIKVTDLLEQVEEERWVREATAQHEGGAEEELPPVRCAVVAVAVGDGLRRIFRSLKVHRVVAGGQTMNPTTEDLLRAVEAVPAEQVVLLPNNKNVVPVARAVAELTAKQVRVVPTASVAEGFAALLDYDPEATADANADRMAEAAASVVTAEVTRAVRDTDSAAGPIRTGDCLGISGDGIAVVAAEPAECVEALLAKLLSAEHEIVTLIEGEGSSPAATRRVTSWLAERFPDVGCEVLQGGQPLYPYLLSIE